MSTGVRTRSTVPPAPHCHCRSRSDLIRDGGPSCIFRHPSTVGVLALGAPSRTRASVHPADFRCAVPVSTVPLAGLPSRSALHVLALATGSVREESVSHEWLRARLTGRGRRDEIASSNHRTYPIEHRTGDRAVGPVPGSRDCRRWPGALLSKETAQKPIVATVVAGWAHTAHWMVIAVRPPSSKGQECRV